MRLLPRRDVTMKQLSIALIQWADARVTGDMVQDGQVIGRQVTVGEQVVEMPFADMKAQMETRWDDIATEEEILFGWWSSPQTKAEPNLAEYKAKDAALQRERAWIETMYVMFVQDERPYAIIRPSGGTHD